MMNAENKILQIAEAVKLYCPTITTDDAAAIGHWVYKYSMGAYDNGKAEGIRRAGLAERQINVINRERADTPGLTDDWLRDQADTLRLELGNKSSALDHIIIRLSEAHGRGERVGYNKAEQEFQKALRAAEARTQQPAGWYVTYGYYSTVMKSVQHETVLSDILPWELLAEVKADLSRKPVVGYDLHLVQVLPLTEEQFQRARQFNLGYAQKT